MPDTEKHHAIGSELSFQHRPENARKNRPTGISLSEQHRTCPEVAMSQEDSPTETPDAVARVGMNFPI